MPDGTVGGTVAHLLPIRGEADYDRMVALMNALLDVTGEDEDHPLSGLLELAAELVSRYELCPSLAKAYERAVVSATVGGRKNEGSSLLTAHSP